MNIPFRVLVLGGYGNFGVVIASRLVRIPNVEVVIAGRNLRKAQTTAQRISATAACISSHAANLAEQFRELKLNLVINTVGPFQGQSYYVAQAAIDAGIHYIDIADAREFVCGIASLDAAAIAKKVLVVSGASSVPALAAAVIDAHLPEFQQLQCIDYGITASESIPGTATVQAVLGYIGKPMRQWQDGKWREVYGWQQTRRHRFVSALGTRWFGNCDVPDLELFPPRYPTAHTVRFQAGLGLRLTHCATWWVSWCVRLKLLKNAAPLAPLLSKFAKLLQPLGNGRSGMFVKLSGIGANGLPLTRVWELSATNNEGVNIPCMAAVALTRKLAEGRLWGSGATACIDMLQLDEYLEELREFAITLSRY